MNEELKQLRHILEFSDADAMPQFEQASTNVLQIFVERVEELEFQGKKHLKPKVKALLELRKNDVANKSMEFSEASAKWSEKSYRISRIVLWVSIAALVLGVIELFKKYNQP